MEEDPWDVRIEATGCAKENERLQLCHADTQDWRQCLGEMKAFRECWAKHKNGERVRTEAMGQTPGDAYDQRD